MTIYAVFDKEAIGAPAVVPDRFSWLAALLPPLFGVVHGLWLELVGYAVLLSALIATSRFIGGDAAFWTYVVFAVWIGFEAGGLRRGALSRRGWRYRREVIAPGEDMAQLEGLRSRTAP